MKRFFFFISPSAPPCAPKPQPMQVTRFRVYGQNTESRFPPCASANKSIGRRLSERGQSTKAFVSCSKRSISEMIYRW